MGKRRLIAVTIGDPAGIGPEVAVKAVGSGRLPKGASIVLVGPERVLHSGAQACNAGLKLVRVPPGSAPSRDADAAQLLDVGACPDEVVPGRMDAACGKASVEYVRAAVELAVKAEVDAVVTAPVSKRAVTLSGMPFQGHTEYIAMLTGARHPVMTFVSDRLRVALVTTHVPLRKVPMLVTTEAVLGTILTVAEGMSAFFGLRGARIGVCGLNPHAGEAGLFGREDDSAIRPAVEAASKKGVSCSGPFPADTLFVRAMKGEFDVVVSMYHDQGLPPVKTVAMGSSANVTLGLPIIRTSVDHGTAFDIAGKGVADPSSMIFAIKTAYEMACASAELF